MTQNPMPLEKSDDFIPLVLRAQRGDNAAFDRLSERFRSFAGAFALARLNDATLAQDAVQEAFLETWVCLPRLRHPAAFPVLLRRVLLKRCDRITRIKTGILVPLEKVEGHTAEVSDLADVVEANRQKKILRSALAMLSSSDRTALLLHYASGESLAEVAAFLGLTVATVKSRLHRARQRLREEILTMERSVREIFSEYTNQVHKRATAGGPVPDPALLARARRKFERELAEHGLETPLDSATVRLGQHIYNLCSDHAATEALFARYLAHSLPPGEALWARWYRTAALAYCHRMAEAVEAHRELRAYANSLPTLPRMGRHYPDTEPFMTPGELALWLLMPMDGRSSVPVAWAAQGVGAEWKTWAEETMAQVPAQEATQRLRMSVRQTLANPMLASVSWANPADRVRYHEEGMQRVEQLRATAEAEGNKDEALRWEIDREKHRMLLARENQDASTMRTIGEELASRVVELPGNHYCRTHAAFALMFVQLYDLAAPILRPRLDQMRDPHELISYAICLWKTTGETIEAASLFKEAQEKYRRNWPDKQGITEHSEWRRYKLGEVPEFVQAVQSASGS